MKRYRLYTVYNRKVFDHQHYLVGKAVRKMKPDGFIAGNEAGSYKN